MKSIKISSLLPLLALCFMLTSCDSDEVVPADAVMAKDITENASSGATVYKDRFKVDFSEENWYFFTGCSDEPLIITNGVWRTYYTIVYNNNKANIQYHSNISNFRLLDEATGITYVGNWVVNSKNQYNIPDFYPYHFKETVRLVLTAPGKGNNIMVKIDFHIKVDENGNVTTYIDNYRADCNK